MRNWKRATRVIYIYIYLRYRKSPGNIRRKSAIVDLCVCEMKRTRYWQQTAIYRSAKISARVYPNYSQSEIRELFPTMNEMSRRGLPRVYIYMYRVSHTGRGVNARKSLCKSAASISRI